MDFLTNFIFNLKSPALCEDINVKLGSLQAVAKIDKHSLRHEQELQQAKSDSIK